MEPNFYDSYAEWCQASRDFKAGMETLRHLLDGYPLPADDIEAANDHH